MNVVDSNGWIQYLEGGPHRALFRPLIHDTEHLLVPATVFYEVYKYFALHYSVHDACQAGFAMKEGRFIETTLVLSFQAADLSLEYKLPHADAHILAVARAYYARLHTLDSHFEGVPGVNYVDGRVANP